MEEMMSRHSTARKPKTQPVIKITGYPAGYERLLELAAKRGYSDLALAGLLASAIAAKEVKRLAQQQAGRKAVRYA
jgi:hypothetical protein